MIFRREILTCKQVVNSNGKHKALSLEVYSKDTNETHMSLCPVDYLIRSYEEYKRFVEQGRLDDTMEFKNFSFAEVSQRHYTIRVSSKVPVYDLPNVKVSYKYVDLGKMSLDRASQTIKGQLGDALVLEDNLEDATSWKRVFNAECGLDDAKTLAQRDMNEILSRRFITANNELSDYNPMVANAIKGIKSSGYVITFAKYTTDEGYIAYKKKIEELSKMDSKIREFSNTKTLKDIKSKFTTCPECESKINVEALLTRRSSEKLLCPICEKGILVGKGYIHKKEELASQRDKIYQELESMRNELARNCTVSYKKQEYIQQNANRKSGIVVCIAEISFTE